jgi:hypothetical protein
MELAGGAILDGAPSAELAALLEGIAEIAVDSAPKFTPGVRQALLGLIVGRAYAPPLLELCHLLRVAALAPRRRFETFFWGVPLARGGAYAGWVRGALRGPAPGPVTILAEPGGVAIVYPDGRFAISYSRMPLLVALMEFLVSALGYPAVLDRAEALLAGPARVAAAGETANELSRAVYAWLAPHLPTVHEKRRLDALVGWLTARHAPAGRSFSTDDIDDAAILDFWRAAEEAEFRTYASVLRGFLLLIDAMEDAAAAIAVARASALGTDREAGEVEPVAPDSDFPLHGASVTSADDVETGGDPLAALAEPPADAVKLLNARERAELEQLLEHFPSGERLALSLLRRAVFGAVQARISEALRRGGPSGAARIVSALHAGEDVSAARDNAPGAYTAWIERTDDLATHLERAMLASLHVLARAGRLEAVHLLLALGPGLDLAPLRAARVLDEPARLGAVLEDPVTAGPEIAALMLRARRSFQGLSRAGFEPEAPTRSAVVDGHAAAAAALPRLAARLGRARGALGRRPPESWAAQQEADRAVFAARFATIYGLQNEEASR